MITYLQIAREDLAYFRASENSKHLYNKSFECQQIAEKYLKYLLTKMKIDSRDDWVFTTHKLDQLYTVLVKYGCKESLDIRELKKLTFCYFMRYPNDRRDLSYVEYRDMVNIMEKVICYAELYLVSGKLETNSVLLNKYFDSVPKSVKDNCSNIKELWSFYFDNLKNW